MSIIQTIRDKAAPLVFGAIAISLIAFVLQDGCNGDKGYLNRTGGSYGSINGVSVSEDEFRRKSEFYEQNIADNQRSEVTDQIRQQVYNGLWSQYIMQIALNQEAEKLGIKITQKQLGELLYGENPPQNIRSLGSDQNGNFNPQQAREGIKRIQKSPVDSKDRIAIETEIENAKLQNINNRFNNMIAAAAYYPKWLAEKETADNNSYANVQYVMIPYTSINDSLITVKDDEINAFVQKHKEWNEFKQDKMRKISYVVFDASASKNDSSALYNKMIEVKAKLALDTNMVSFFSLNQSDIDYSDMYNAKSKIQTPYKDSVFALSKGQVYGPYLDGNFYTIAKLVESKIMPDSVKAKHILIATSQRDQSGNMIPVVADSIAEKRIDSIIAAIKNGASFDSLAKKLSDDNGGGTGGSAARGGLLGGNGGSDYFAQGVMVKEFNDYCFIDGKPGERKKVKTAFGYHYIEIVDQKNFEPFYKVAYFTKKIQPSSETINSASVACINFISEASNKQLFDSSAKKRNLPVVLADIREGDFSLTGVGMKRDFVINVYKAKKNKIWEETNEFTIDNVVKFVAFIVTDIKEEGIKNASEARPYVEARLRNKKKAELLLKKIGNNNNLQAVATANNVQVQRADSIAFASPGVLGIRAGGAAFNKVNLNKESSPIVGEAGVYIIKTEQVFTKASLIDPLQTKQQNETRWKQNVTGNPQFQQQGIVDVLINKAKTEDNRMKKLIGD